MAASPPETSSLYDGLRSQLRGSVLLPNDGGYSEATRLWNAAIERHPAAIARCRDVADVVATIRFARAHQLPISVRGGGHGVSGSALVEDGLVVDLSLMRAVLVDPDHRRVWAQGGALWGDVDHASQLYGLAVPGGFVSTTGVGGFTLGGGIAWTSRKLGLACDRLFEAEVVTANGEVLHVTEKNHPDLLWGLRGAGSQFGVVTAFGFEAQPVGPIVYGGLKIFPESSARTVLRLVADMYRESPEELNLLAVLTTAPAAPFIPPDLQGKRIAAVACCFIGPPEEGPRAARRLLELPNGVVEQIGPVPYSSLQSAFDAGNPAGHLNYWKSTYAEAITDAAIETVVHQFARVPSPLSELHLQYFGGAVSRIAAGRSAIGNRQSPFLFNLIGKWAQPSESNRNIAWVRETWDALQPHSTGGTYVNFLSDQSPTAVRAAYGEDVLRRLRSVKTRYDPENIFKGSHPALLA